VGNCPQQLANNRAASLNDSEINSAKKLSKTRKYEGKRFELASSGWFSRSARAAEINRSVEELSVFLIVAAGRLSNMFTTYSHTLCGRPRQLA
jgi:hypothetical protein